MEWRCTQIFLAFCALLWLSGCGYFEQTLPPVSPQARSSLMPPPTFREADLMGQWENINTQYYNEMIVLTADHRFTHVYDQRDGHPIQSQGTWQLEPRASGCVYLHMYGMRYVHGIEPYAGYGNRFAPGGDPVPMWDRCEAQRTPMLDQVILTVSDLPNLPRGIGLLFLSTKNPPDESVELRIITDAAGHPVPTPTPHIVP